jgi:hypothetical protein
MSSWYLDKGLETLRKQLVDQITILIKTDRLTLSM